MKGYATQDKDLNGRDSACAKSLESISPKSALKVARTINGMNLGDAKSFLNSLIQEKVSIANKFYTTSAASLLDVIFSAELNAERKDMDTEKLKLNISVHKGPKRMRGRRKRNFGLQLKLANIQVILFSMAKAKKARAEVADAKKSEQKSKQKKADVKKE